jgi:hypothetical protein
LACAARLYRCAAAAPPAPHARRSTQHRILRARCDALTPLLPHASRSFESASAHLEKQSPPLALPGTAGATPLRLFASAAVPLAKAGGGPLARPAADAACFVGAPVWALDWCPRASGSRDDFLALGTHAAGAGAQTLGRAASGPAALQLWRVPRPPSSAAAAQAPPAKKPRGRPPKAARTTAADADDASPSASDEEEGDASSALPSLSLLLTHGGACAWDVKWRPAAPASATSASLGLLAAALGDGDVVVTAVPRPAAGAKAAATALRPAWRGRGGPACARAGGLPWTLDWHPSAPHAKLIAGTTDGRVLLFDLTGCADAASSTGPDAALPQPPLLQLLPAAGPPLAVRSVCWAPAALGPACAALLLSAGDDGSFTVWDARSPEAPAWRGRGAQSLLLSAAWTAKPRAFVASADGGRVLITGGVLGRAPEALRDVTLRPGGQSVLRASPTGAAVWGLHAIDDVLAYCNADGELVATQLWLPQNGRAKPHRVVLASQTADAARPGDSTAAGGASTAAAAAAPVTLRLRSARAEEDQVAGDAEGDLNNFVIDALTMPRQQALHRCRWAHGNDRTRGLATAGAAGVLRIVHVTLR